MLEAILVKLKHKLRKPKSGMTILEVMVVLAIMALVIGLAAPRFIDSFGRAKSQTAEVRMGNLKSSLQLFYVDVGRYPTPAEGLDALLRAPQGVTGWRGPYLDKEYGILDPWGRRYVIVQPGTDQAFDLQSLGHNGQPGGTGEDSDLML